MSNFAYVYFWLPFKLCFAVRELSEEEKQMVILSDKFQQFMSRAGRIMERALCETVDIYTDYSGIGEEALDEKCHQRISFNRTFYDERFL